MRVLMALALFLVFATPASTAELDLSSSNAYAFRSRLREAFRMPPNFNERYRFATWGCGSSCTTGAIINLKSGSVYMLGMSVCCSKNGSSSFEPIRFELHNNMVTLSGQINEEGDDIDHHYKFDGNRLLPANEIVNTSGISELQRCLAIRDDDDAKLKCLNRNLPREKPAETALKSLNMNSLNLGSDDIPKMHSTYDKNEARFFRDYAGRPFSAALRLNRASQSLFDKSAYNVSFGDGFTGDLSCRIIDMATIDMITDADKGNILTVSGRVKDHTLGTIELEDCHITK